MLKISVVIPVSNDLLIKECLNSIDEEVEVIISLNQPSKEIKYLVKDMINLRENELKYQNLDIKTCEINYPSIAGAYNNGIYHASYDQILLMDSDCIFAKGCIRRLWTNLGKNFLSKGRVVFSYDSWLTKIVSKAREFHTSDKINAYSPPLLFKKEVIRYVGGYYFHPSLCWLEDSEFNKRVQAANLNISYDSEAIVYHPPLTPIKDLKSSFWYGVGKRIGVELGVHDKPTGIVGSIRKYIFEASKIKGVLPGLYLFIWKAVLLFGYYFQSVVKIRKNRV